MPECKLPPEPPPERPPERPKLNVDKITGPYIEEPYINQFWGPMLGATTAFLAVCFGNWANRAPMLSGIPKHVVITALGWTIGNYVDERRKRYLAERDATMFYYMNLHQDEFKDLLEPKEIYFQDWFEPWTPIR